MANTVLVIEDDRVMGEVMVFNLRQHGFQTQIASTGRQALEILTNHVFQVILMTYQTRNMEGKEICRSIREIPAYTQTPIIICSSKSYEIDAAKVRDEFGVVNILPKPFSPSELIMLVQEMVGSHHEETLAYA